ncbi:hypothetical protein A616_06470 [Brevibacillus brevis X23]|nr:hypothetical protein A616_06470 [Brevibacillus brevis X23]
MSKSNNGKEFSFIERLREILQTSPEDKKLEDSHDGIYLFISFDLVNSTSFKSVYPNDWPLVFQRFYEFVESDVLSRFTNARVWRYAGDEILFYKRICNFSDLLKSPEDALSIIRSVTNSLNNTIPQTKNRLFLKSTLWVADCSYVPPHSLENKYDDVKGSISNLIIFGNYNNKSSVDFLGADIDLGFRISEYAWREKVVVSAELAYIMYLDRGKYRDYDIEERLKIISYQSLKGIWNERRYPIIWYHDHWNDLDKMFYYDEHFDSPVIERVKQGSFDNEMKIKRLTKIFADLGKEHNITNIITKIQYTKPEGISETDLIAAPNVSQYKLVEVHCAAVCFNDEGKILIAKRPSKKRRLNGVWEFGCGQLKKSQSFEECLGLSYKEDFSAEIDTFGSAIPVSTYVIEDRDEKRKIPGILFLAKILNQEEVEKSFNKEKHTEVQWFDPTKLTQIKEEDYVPNFKDTVQKALDLWLRINDK